MSTVLYIISSLYKVLKQLNTSAFFFATSDFQLKFDKKNILVALLFQRLTATQLQHLLKKTA